MIASKYDYTSDKSETTSPTIKIKSTLGFRPWKNCNNGTVDGMMQYNVVRMHSIHPVFVSYILMWNKRTPYTRVTVILPWPTTNENCSPYFYLPISKTPKLSFLGYSTLRGTKTIRASCKCLTHWGWDKMADIPQTTFSNAFSWMKMYEFRLRFHWSLLSVQLTIFHHWFR